jgi:hypothetical protein
MCEYSIEPEQKVICRIFGLRASFAYICGVFMVGNDDRRKSRGVFRVIRLMFIEGRVLYISIHFKFFCEFLLIPEVFGRLRVPVFIGTTALFVSFIMVVLNQSTDIRHFVGVVWLFSHSSPAPCYTTSVAVRLIKYICTTGTLHYSLINTVLLLSFGVLLSPRPHRVIVLKAKDKILFQPFFTYFSRLII